MLIEIPGNTIDEAITRLFDTTKWEIYIGDKVAQTRNTLQSAMNYVADLRETEVSIRPKLADEVKVIAAVKGNVEFLTLPNSITTSEPSSGLPSQLGSCHWSSRPASWALPDGSLSSS
jgi:hypoxanthine phosphoribosyltransferase